MRYSNPDLNGVPIEAVTLQQTVECDPVRGAARQTAPRRAGRVGNAGGSRFIGYCAGVTVVGTAFRVMLSDGTVLAQENLPGSG